MDYIEDFCVQRVEFAMLVSLQRTEGLKDDIVFVIDACNVQFNLQRPKNFKETNRIATQNK